MVTLKTLKAPADLTTWFDALLAKWPTQWAGSKPTPAMLAVPILLGKRPGVEALYIAMALRPEGCTVQQFTTAGNCGPANNYRRALERAGLIKVTGRPYAYVATVTAKGFTAIEKALAAAKAAEKPEKANGKAKPARKAAEKPEVIKKVGRKPRAPKVAPPPPPPPPPPVVTEPLPAPPELAA